MPEMKPSPQKIGDENWNHRRQGLNSADAALKLKFAAGHSFLQQEQTFLNTI